VEGVRRLNEAQRANKLPSRKEASAGVPGRGESLSQRLAEDIHRSHAFASPSRCVVVVPVAWRALLYRNAPTATFLMNSAASEFSGIRGAAGILTKAKFQGIPRPESIRDYDRCRAIENRASWINARHCSRDLRQVNLLNQKSPKRFPAGAGFKNAPDVPAGTGLGLPIGQIRPSWRRV
jgi:hypothetical protein